ncbi:MAG: FG-GAP-like repeat-containing protein [Chloroflexota bacterium]|nr:FG-GAP-like repeat-containing protein [Chloroflexota bacterium]MDE2960378.1 FG-GAP-like repeat-containing protein [Chloroflexota bacterium]
MFDTTLKKKRVIGIVLLAVILSLFLAFNRIPKLDTVEADLAGVNAPRAECFQGFCINREPETGFFERWWDFSTSYLKLVTVGMIFAFLAAGITEVFLFPSVGGSRFTGGGIKGVLRGFAVGSSMNLCSACIVPIASAFRNRGAPVETAIAMTQGSSTLNLPALVMAALVFTPMLASTRIAVSIAGVLLLGPLVALLVRRQVRLADIFRGGEDGSAEEQTTWRDIVSTGFKDWLKSSLRYLWRLGPAMILAGIAGGLVIQWVTPDTVAAYLGDNVSGIAVAATLGILINVPLLFEIPLVVVLMLVGMGTAPAAALLFGAAAAGPFTLWGLARVMPKKAVAAFAAGTWSLSMVGGVGLLLVGPFFMDTSDSRIVFSSDRDGDFEIYSMFPDGSDRKRLTNNSGYDDMPAWSPYGKKIAFVSDRHGNPEIYVMNADGSRVRRLTQDNGPDNALPAWSPDGDRIAYSSGRDGNREIYVMDSDGSNLVNLTNDPGYDSSPAWSPDGQRILFNTRRDGNLEIYVMDADGSNQVRLTRNATSDEFPTWSPDGSKIAFSSNRTGPRAVYVMDADGSNPVQLTGDNFRDYWPSWSPDGTRITFTSDRYGAPEIMSMNADGSHQVNLSHGPGADSASAWGPGDLPPADTQGPRISSLYPPAAATSGGSLVTVTGSGLEAGSRVIIGGQEAPVLEFLDSRAITIETPPRPAGVVDVMITNPDGRSGTLPGGFTYRQPLFTEVAAEAGVAFQHFRDPVDRIPLGAGVVVFDFNNDGRQDIYVASKPSWDESPDQIDGANALYRNDGNGTFTDVAAEAGVDELMGLSNGGCAADYDNDGDQDLYVTNWGSSKLFRNNGSGRFVDATDHAGLGDPDPSYRSMGCAWGDYDRDGHLDFVIVRHMEESDMEAFDLRLFYLAVRPLGLFHNNGDGTFTEVSHLLGDGSAPQKIPGEYGNLWGAGFQPGWVDFDNDGDSDLYVVNDFGHDVQPNVLWRNDGPGESGAWQFEDISRDSRTDVPMFGMGLAVGDYDLDGHFDLYVTNIEDNVLLKNNGDGLTFTESAADAGAGMGAFQRRQRVSWGTVFFDYDNDGWEDLYVASGHLDSDRFTNHRHQPNLLLRNTGLGTFEDISSISGANDRGVGRGVAYADFNDDGCLDLYVANLGLAGDDAQSARLFQNSCAGDANWLRVHTVGTTSNRDGIGARVTVVADGRTQIREITAGSSNKSQSMLPAHFGLGRADKADSVQIRWPSGIVQTIHDVPANQRLTVVEAP